MKRNRYSAGAVSYTFWFMEFRKVVQLLSDGKTYDEIKKLSEEENIFGAPSKARASLGYILGNDDRKIVSYPTSSNVFKVSGGGQNYVHGGSSPQEMLVPVIDIKMERGKQETKNVQIALVSMVQKITNLITTMDFIQSEPVSDTIKQTTYKTVFIDEDGERISNENTYVADIR